MDASELRRIVATWEHMTNPSSIQILHPLFFMEHPKKIRPIQKIIKRNTLLTFSKNPQRKSRLQGGIMHHTEHAFRAK